MPSCSRKALIVVLLLVLGLAQAWYELRSSGVQSERGRLSDSFATPVIRFTPPVKHRNGLVAILVHGHQCNKAMMAPLARYLATTGIDAYTIDLPGHGESREAFSTQNAISATEAALSEVARKTGILPERLILIGHSFGAMALGPSVLAHPPLASIFIGPGKPAGLSTRLPTNVLIITAEHDYDYIKSDAQTMFDALTAPDRPPPGNVVGRFEQKEARLWEVIPGAAHVSLLVDERVHRTVARWIERSSQQSFSTTASYSTGVAARAVGLASALGLAIALLIASLAKPSRAVSHVDSSRQWLRPAIAIAAGLYFSVLLIRESPPLRFLQVSEGDAVASLLAAAGLLGFAFLAALDQRIPARPAARDLALGALVFLLLYGLALLTIDGEFYNLRIGVGDRRRWMTLAMVAALSAPGFLLQEELFRRLELAAGPGWRKWAVACAASLLLAGMFCVSLYFLGGRLSRFNAEVFALLLYCSAVNAIFRTHLKNPSAGVLFSSLVAGWIVSVGFFHY